MTRLSILLKAGFLCVAACGAGVATDVILNDGHFLAVATGQAGVAEACLPELRKTLSDRGFAPTDIVFGQKPDLWLNYRAERRFTSDFTFEDGPEERRVDGVMACRLGKDDVSVEVATSAHPVRAG